jgi:hypothetical protein
MKMSGRLLLVLAVAGATFALASPASAATTLTVGPGQSIQAAINRAHPGDTIVVKPGTYRENLTIQKDHITLHGSGQFRGGTLLLPASRPTPSICTDPSDPTINGICVVGQVDQNFNLIRRTFGVRVTGFHVHGFSGIGILGFGDANLSVDHTRETANGEYGITSFDSTGSHFIENEVSGSEEAGLYIGDTPNSNAVLRGNNVHNNELTGILIRNASYGLAEYNSTHDNCIGIFALAGAPGPVRGWNLRRNDVFHNNEACAASEEAPPLSGIGIALAGTKGASVVENNVVNNRPSGPSAYHGGIVLAKAAPGYVPRDNTVRGNVAFGNRPVDLFYDGTGRGNVWVNNSCDTSQPAGHC